MLKGVLWLFTPCMLCTFKDLEEIARIGMIKRATEIADERKKRIKNEK